MDNLDKELQRQHGWWDTNGAAWFAKLDDVRAVIKEKNDNIGAIKDLSSGFNPVKFLQNSWKKAVHVSRIKSEIKQHKEETSTLMYSLSERADADADTVLALVVAGQVCPKITQNISERETIAKASAALSGIETQTSSVLNVISRAWQECDEAQDMETVDMVSSSPLASVLSHGETQEAADHLEKANEALSEYMEFMERAKGELFLVDNEFDVDELLEVAEWDLWFGVLDFDILSFFSSWENHEKLGKAKDKLDEIKDVISPVLSNVKTRIGEYDQQGDALKGEYNGLRQQRLRGLDLPADLSRALNTFRMIDRAPPTLRHSLKL